jgi:small subunit ribosomal protein S9
VTIINPWVWGTGRRKNSVARVRIKSGSGQFTVNGRPFEQFFTTDDTRRQAQRPLKAVEAAAAYDVFVNVEGGGIMGQAGAVSLGVARALKTDNPTYEAVLRQHGLLTRDPRKVERKKYGHRKARRSTQYSKR